MPPLRFCMTSSDVLCARSMELEWENGTGLRQQWSSWNASSDGSWYGAEKFLPSSVYDISVRFRVHVPGGPWPVMRVNRHQRCSWIGQEGQREEEVIRFRSSPLCAGERVDVTFELKGPAHVCYLYRAWNACNNGVPQSWEVWEGADSKPLFQESESLDAADSAAPLIVSLGDPALFYKCTKKRMCAALRALSEVHRESLQALSDLDGQFSLQWAGANVGNTTSAGLGIASAVCLFVAPPVGIGLGIGSAVTAGLTFAGDVAATHAHNSAFRRQLSRDAWNALAAAELLREWIEAQQALGASGKQSSLEPGSIVRVDSCSSVTRCSRDQAIDGGLYAGSAVNMGCGAGTQIASKAGAAVAAASQVVGIAGALIQTGFAIRGWTSMSSGQQMVRFKVQELSSRILQIQHLLAAVDRLECPACSDDITLADDVRHCKDRLHCFHARCVRRVGRQGASQCLLCGCDVLPETDVMVEFSAKYERSCVSHYSGACGRMQKARPEPLTVRSSAR